MIKDFLFLHPGKKWPDLKSGQIEKIYVIGSTGVGKTTLVNYIKDKTNFIKQGILQVPLRYITRPARRNDDIIENRHVTQEEFDHHLAQGDIGVHWRRDLGGQHFERYGFAALRTNAVPLYSANMALVRSDAQLLPDDSLENSLIIGVYLPADIRFDRFAKRSPDVLLNKAEAEKRLSDDPRAVFDFCHVVVDNQHPIEETGAELARFLERLFIK